jgi:16S rRNA processing protein RimM
VRETNGTESLVPFVRAIVPVVDVPGGRVVIDPPAGLLAGVGEPEIDHPSEG